MIYHEKFRPQFHFTAQRGWLNDPNGLVFHNGIYHLFYQFEIPEMKKGWGHAISHDLIHWEDLGMAIPGREDYGEAWSGSAIVDPNGKRLRAFFTGHKTWSQYMAISDDQGKTWKVSPNDPVVPMITLGNRDPKVFWYEPSQQWIMVLWKRGDQNLEGPEKPEEGEYLFLNSKDFLHWQPKGSIKGFYECPDLFQLPVQGTPIQKWVLVNGNGNYVIGEFDGSQFYPESSPIRGTLGPNFYATQTWNHVPGNRIIQLAWMNNGWISDGNKEKRYPGMPFDQQMTFPCELTLSLTKNGLRLYRLPIKEIQSLYAQTIQVNVDRWNTSDHYVEKCYGELWDLSFQTPDFHHLGISFLIKGEILCFHRNQISFLGRDFTLELPEDRYQVRMLIDRMSVEIFINQGYYSLSFCLPPHDRSLPLEIQKNHPQTQLDFLTLHSLKSIWIS